jgi:hypothetical protein
MIVTNMLNVCVCVYVCVCDVNIYTLLKERQQDAGL